MPISRTTSGQLVESADTFQDRVKNLNLGSTPVSPAVAKGLGATKQQTSMIGTPAQKKPILQEQIKKEDTLEGVERLSVGQRVDTTEADKAAAERAEQLGQLGSLSLRVQDLVQSNFEQIAQQQLGQAQVSTSMLGQSLGLSEEEAQIAKTDPNSSYSQITNILTQFRDSTDPAAGEQALASLGNLKDPNTGLPYVDPLLAKSLIDTTAAAAGKTVATQMIDQVTIGDIGEQRIQEMGFSNMNELADLLNIPAEDLQEMTIPQLDATIQQLRNDEYNKIATIKAQMKSAPVGSIERDRLAQQLKQLGQAGITGIEFDVKETADDINLAESVKIGGNIWSTEELLQDDNLSQLISDWVASDPKEREDLIPSNEYPELTEWLDHNQTALSELSLSLGETTKSFESAQQAWKDLGFSEDHDITISNDILTTLLPNWDKTKSVTSAELQEMKSELNASNLGQIMNNFQVKDESGNMVNALSSEEQQALLTKLTGLKDPKTINDLFGPESTLSASKLIDSSRSADKISNDTTLQQLLNDKFGTEFTGKDSFILDIDKQAQIKEYGEAVDLLRSEGKSNWISGVGVGYDEFKQLNADQMMEMVSATNADERFSNWTKWKKNDQNIKDAERSRDIDDVLDLAFDGSNINAAILQDQYDELKHWANMGEPEALRLSNYFEKNLGFADGQLNDEDFSLFMDRVKGLQSTVGESDFISDTGNVDTLFSSMKSLLNESKEARGRFKVTPSYQKYANLGIIGPGKTAVSTSEIEQFIDNPMHNETDLIAWLEDNPHIKKPWSAGSTGKRWINSLYDKRTAVISDKAVADTVFATPTEWFKTVSLFNHNNIDTLVRVNNKFTSHDFQDMENKFRQALNSVVGNTPQSQRSKAILQRNMHITFVAKEKALETERTRHDRAIVRANMAAISGSTPAPISSTATPVSSSGGFTTQQGLS